MATLEPTPVVTVDAALAYGEQRYAEGAASRQAEVDAIGADLERANLQLIRSGELATRLSGERDAAIAELTEHMASEHPVAPEPEPEPPAPQRQLILGVSAFPEVWDQRLAEVGASGITARRIFCNFTSSGRDKESLIREAIADGMMPILSYKGSPTAANVAAVRTFLNSLGVPVTATWHHEPHNDMTPAAFRDGSTAMLAAKSPTIKVGPILNGWLLDNLNATSRPNWQDYTSPALLDAWDFLGLDTYSEGTVANPSTTLLCGRAIPKAVTWLAQQGHPDMPILIGEYNGQTTAAIEYAGQQILNTSQVWVACMWNMDHYENGVLTFNALSGARLTAFKATKADPRVKR